MTAPSGPSTIGFSKELDSAVWGGPNGAALASGASAKYLDQLGTIDNQFEVVIQNAPATVSVSITPYMRGGTAGTPVTSTSTTSSIQSVTGPYDYYLVTVSWTGGTAGQTSITVNRTGVTGH
jgi:hypothetical protein